MTNSWPFEYAQQVLALVQAKGKDKAVFQAGFGPTGSIHAGTISEIIRTNMVIKAFKTMSDIPTKLIVFIDDLDPFKKIPQQFTDEQKELLTPHLGKAVCYVPNVFNTPYDNFSNNVVGTLKELLVQLKIDNVEIMLSSDFYRSGQMNGMLLLIADKIEAVEEIVTHDFGTNGGDRKDWYCPFLPIEDGYIIQDLKYKIVEPQYISYIKKDGAINTISYLDGKCKLQWKVDWFARQSMNDVDFEMNGKDLISSAEVGDKLFDLFGLPKPVRMTYELFLADDGKKVSKSVGNGLELSEFINYCPLEAIYWFAFQNPFRARKLHWDIIPNITDSYLKEEVEEGNGSWFIEKKLCPVSYNMLINIAGISNTTDKNILMKYLTSYDSSFTIENYPILDNMIDGAIRYYTQYVLPFKEYKIASEEEINTIKDIVNMVYNMNILYSEGKYITLNEEVQSFEQAIRYEIFEIGKKYYGKKGLVDFFKMLYGVLMGQESGPQFYQFICMLGADEFIKYTSSIIG